MRISEIQGIARLLLMAGLLLSYSKGHAQNVYDLRKFLPKTGNKGNVRMALQTAIDQAHKAGGGTVVVPGGTYTISTVFLKSNVRLQLEAGATIQASRNPADYTFTKGIKGVETDVPVLLYGKDLSNVEITGKGKIDGMAEHTYEGLRELDNFILAETENAKKAGIEMKRYYANDPKVCLVYIVDSKNLTFTDFTLYRSPNWTLHLQNCERVSIRGMYVYSSLEKGVNSDGIDIDGCRDVKITDCTITTGDDAICLKSTSKNGEYAECQNITITNCNVQSTSCALKIGTESHGNFKNIIFSNCNVSNTNRALGIFVRDGATVDQVIFSNINIACDRKHFNWWGDGDPIRIVLLKRKPDSRLGNIRNVLIENVIATGQGTSLVAGFDGDGTSPSRAIQNITIRNSTLRMEAEDLADKRATDALQCKHVEGLKISNLTVEWDRNKNEKLWASGVRVNTCTDVQVDGYKGTPGGNNEKVAALHFVNTKSAKVVNSVVKGLAKEFMLVEGKASENILVRDDFPGDPKKFVRIASDVAKKMVVFE